MRDLSALYWQAVDFFKDFLGNFFFPFRTLFESVPPVELLSWAGICLAVGGTFLALIMVRITTPRMRLESLSRLSWGTLLGYLAILVLAYFCGYFVA